MKVTREAVMAAVEAGAVSLSGIGKHMGVKGNISGSTTKQIRAVVPGIADMLVINKRTAAGEENLFTVAEIAKENGVKMAPVAPVKAAKVVKVVQVGPASPKMADKAAALARYEATKNPFEAGCMKAIVYEHGSKAFRPLKAILTESANDPKFKALCPKGEKMGNITEGRYKRAYWQYTMIRGNHPGNHGVTDWAKAEGDTRCKGHDRVVKAVMVGV